MNNCVEKLDRQMIIFMPCEKSCYANRLLMAVLYLYSVYIYNKNVEPTLPLIPQCKGLRIALLVGNEQPRKPHVSAHI